MMRALTVAVLLAAAPMVGAEDLEGLLEGKSSAQNQNGEAQLIRGQSLLADAIRSMAQVSTPEQNFFMRNIEKQEWSEALINWDSAFGGKPFETSESGKALRAYLQFKAGLPVTGLENLFAIDEAKKIHFLLLNMWREAAPETHPAWLVSRITWKPDFNELFGPAIEVKVRAADLSGAHKIEELQALSLRAPADSREQAIINWHLALANAMQDKAAEAAKIMAQLLKAKNNPVSQDLMNITAARMLFQNGYFEAAQKYYDKVPKKSEDYLEAQEEKAWTYLRRGEPQNAMAITQSLVNPSFSGQVGPETWFLRALSQIKVCDYSGTLETLRGFTKEFKDHALALEALAENKVSQDELAKFLSRMQKGSVTRTEMVRSTRKLPRNLTRDERLKYLLTGQTVLEKEAQSADVLFAKSLKTTGLQGHFDTLRAQTLERSQMARGAAIARAQELAREELAETHKVVNKMHIVETELIQQVDTIPRISKHLGVQEKDIDVKKGTTGSLARDTLKFPQENEFWFDELTNYRVDVKKGCQVRVTR